MSGDGRAAPNITELTSIRRARLAIFWIFGLCGVICSLWSTSLPSLNTRLHLGATRLGIVLLLLGAGAVATMPLTGRLCDRLGSAALGLATVVPAIFSAVGERDDGVGRALSWVAVCAYGGELAGPAVIGPVAGATSLRFALLVPTALAVVIAAVGPVAIARSIRPSRRGHATASPASVIEY